MLRHPVVVADTIPMFRKEVTETDSDHPVLSRQGPEHGIPGAEIPERSMYADQWRAFSDFEKGHVISIHLDRLHDQPARKSSTISEYFRGACSNIGCVAPRIISVFEFAT